MKITCIILVFYFEIEGNVESCCEIRKTVKSLVRKYLTSQLFTVNVNGAYFA